MVATRQRPHLAFALELLSRARDIVAEASDTLEASWYADEGIDGEQRERLLRLCNDIGNDVGNFPGFISQEDEP